MNLVGTATDLKGAGGQGLRAGFFIFSEKIKGLDRRSFRFLSSVNEPKILRTTSIYICPCKREQSGTQKNGID